MRSINEIKNEWKAALTEFGAAVQEYEKFIVAVPEGKALEPENISNDELKIAYDRLSRAQNWLSKLKDEHFKTVEALKEGETRAGHHKSQ